MKSEKELLKMRKETMDNIKQFYDKLPELGSIDAVVEFKHQTDALIDYIIALEEGYKHA